TDRLSDHLTPRFFPFDHGIEHHNELPHAGNQRHFGKLSLGLEALVKLFENRVALNRREHGHEHHGAYSMATTAYASFALNSPTVPVQRRHANQRRDLLSV